MLRYDRQTKPGLVALYDIRPGNGAGQFLQPQSPHGAYLHKSKLHLLNCKVVKQQYQCSIFTTLQLNITKKRSEETQTLHAGCSKVEPKFRPAADPLHGGMERPKFNQLEMVITFTYKPSLVRINAPNFQLSY